MSQNIPLSLFNKNNLNISLNCYQQNLSHLSVLSDSDMTCISVCMCKYMWYCTYVFVLSDTIINSMLRYIFQFFLSVNIIQHRKQHKSSSVIFPRIDPMELWTESKRRRQKKSTQTRDWNMMISMRLKIKNKFIDCLFDFCFLQFFYHHKHACLFIIFWDQLLKNCIDIKHVRSGGGRMGGGGRWGYRKKVIQFLVDWNWICQEPGYQ